MMEHQQGLREPGSRLKLESAGWGKRLALFLMLTATTAFGSAPKLSADLPSQRVAPELRQLLAKAEQGTAGNETVRVIVQYHTSPTAAHFARMQSLGGRLHTKLNVVKGAAFTIPVSALAALENDSEVGLE